MNLAWTFLVMARLNFAWFYAVDQGLGPVEALQASWDATAELKGNCAALIVMSLVVIADRPPVPDRRRDSGVDDRVPAAGLGLPADGGTAKRRFMNWYSSTNARSSGYSPAADFATKQRLIGRAGERRAPGDPEPHRLVVDLLAPDRDARAGTARAVWKRDAVATQLAAFMRMRRSFSSLISRSSARSAGSSPVASARDQPHLARLALEAAVLEAERARLVARLLAAARQLRDALDVERRALLREQRRELAGPERRRDAREREVALELRLARAAQRVVDRAVRAAAARPRSARRSRRGRSAPRRSARSPRSARAGSRTGSSSRKASCVDPARDARLDHLALADASRARRRASRAGARCRSPRTSGSGRAAGSVCTRQSSRSSVSASSDAASRVDLRLDRGRHLAAPGSRARARDRRARPAARRRARAAGRASVVPIVSSSAGICTLAELARERAPLLDLARLEQRDHAVDRHRHARLARRRARARLRERLRGELVLTGVVVQARRARCSSTRRRRRSRSALASSRSRAGRSGSASRAARRSSCARTADLRRCARTGTSSSACSRPRSAAAPRAWSGRRALRCRSSCR